MQVVAFSTPRDAEWRWRIVDDTGDLVEESADVFPSIAAAVADGALHLRARDDRDIASMSGRNRRPSYRRGE